MAAERAHFRQSSLSDFQGAPVLDPDALAKSVRETTVGEHCLSSQQVNEILRQAAESLLGASESFTVETTFPAQRICVWRSARDRSDTRLVGVFIGTDSVEINIERVKARVTQRWPRHPGGGSTQKISANARQHATTAFRCAILSSFSTTRQRGHRTERSVAFGDANLCDALEAESGARRGRHAGLRERCRPGTGSTERVALSGRGWLRSRGPRGGRA